MDMTELKDILQKQGEAFEQFKQANDAMIKAKADGKSVEAFEAKLGDDWCRSYLDRCGWQDVPERALIPATRTAGVKIVREGRAILAALGLTVLERAA